MVGTAEQWALPVTPYFLPDLHLSSVSLRACLGPSTCQTVVLRDGSLFSIRKIHPIPSHPPPISSKQLKWETLVMVPASPRELPVTRYMELPASEVHPPSLPSHGLCLVGGSDQFFPSCRKMTLETNQRWTLGARQKDGQHCQLSDVQC